MTISLSQPRLFALYALFAASGFAGLIYESIWSHYLKLFLGHAAYAQTLVLAIFMGGMAVGAWLAGTALSRISRPLLWYVGLEVVIGVFGMAFDPLFQAMQSWFFSGFANGNVLAPALVEGIKWLLAALLVLPQSILLGATFPLISAGVVRSKDGQNGKKLAWLYFTNSLGAAAGVLASGFFLIDRVGLPGTLLTAALINFFLAAAVYVWARSLGQPLGPPAQEQKPAPLPELLPGTSTVLMTTAFFTGLASFLYEIGWIRMLSMVLGSTTHAFELMLSVFILGIALGSFWIRNRIDTQGETLRILGIVQVVMAAAAFLSLPLYMQSFEVMAAFWHGVQSNDIGYVLFTAASLAICAALMLPATFCAGMTLPLITASLLKTGYGEASVGRVYAINTAGAISGIVLAVHVIMPVLGLRQVVIIGATVDLALGLWLLSRYWAGAGPAWRAAVLLVATAPFVLALSTQFDPKVTGSGVYRVGKSQLEGEMLFHADGKTATVDVSRFEDGTVSIATNGKVDAGLNLRGIVGPDDYTMVMLALLPSAMLPSANSAAVIGMGSGTTTHVLLQNPRLRSVDTIEIEPAMIEGARQFGAATAAAFTDPRSRLHVDDAKTYFARGAQRYGLIVSEPSNPWVSGIASLFSLEFYEQIKSYLTEDGLFVQWLHLYEINPALIATVMNALASSFADYAVYANNGDDIMIIAKPHGRLPSFDAWVFDEPSLRTIMHKLGLRSVADMEVRKLGGKGTLQAYFRSLDSRVNSDYFPVLDQGASRQRFLIGDARTELDIHPYALRLENRDAVLEQALSNPSFFQPIPGRILAARALAASLTGGGDEHEILDLSQKTAIAVLRSAATQCKAGPEPVVLESALRLFVRSTTGMLTPAAVRRTVDFLTAAGCHIDWSPRARAWLAFYEDAGAKRHEKLRHSALVLLQELLSDPEAAQFVLAELLLADLALGDPGAALGHLSQMVGLQLTPPLKYLRAQAQAGLANAAP